MTKALIVYATRAGETRKIGELIAEGLRFSGIEVTMLDAAAVRQETDLQGYDTLIFGSATYHGEMLAGMKTLLFIAEKAGLEGKVGAALALSAGAARLRTGCRYHEACVENEYGRCRTEIEIRQLGRGDLHGPGLRP